MRELLNLHELVNLDCAWFCDSSNIISSQINEHHVFSSLFGIIQQIFRQLFIFFLGRTAFSCAGYRMSSDKTFLDLDE
jgi:hypothetical protein